MFDTRSSETTGYHIFLEPSGELGRELQTVVNELAETHGGPSFPPHVTLLARVEGADVHERTQALATSLEPFSLTLGPLDGEDEYFRAFYIRMEETAAVVAAHEKANALFGVEDARPYLPHISLLYGNIPDVLREKLIAETRYPKGTVLEVSRLHLYETQGATASWRKVGEFMLGA